jgi:hypothetical protein
VQQPAFWARIFGFRQVWAGKPVNFALSVHIFNRQQGSAKMNALPYVSLPSANLRIMATRRS